MACAGASGGGCCYEDEGDAAVSTAAVEVFAKLKVPRAWGGPGAPGRAAGPGWPGLRRKLAAPVVPGALQGLAGRPPWAPALAGRWGRRPRPPHRDFRGLELCRSRLGVRSKGGGRQGPGPGPRELAGPGGRQAEAVPPWWARGRCQ